ncbi:MAG: hypothetical protein K0Q97_2583, partial [Bacillota bacterium]|nr:hypothetical protein [Bacillota bacterium]
IFFLAKRNLPVLLANRAEIFCGGMQMKKIIALLSSLVALVLASGAGMSWL